jgi:hypothetical protein
MTLSHKAFKMCDIFSAHIFYDSSTPSRHKKSSREQSAETTYLTKQTPKHLWTFLKNLPVGKFSDINLPCCRRILSAVSY